MNFSQYENAQFYNDKKLSFLSIKCTILDEIKMIVNVLFNIK